MLRTCLAPRRLAARDRHAGLRRRSRRRPAGARGDLCDERLRLRRMHVRGDISGTTAALVLYEAAANFLSSEETPWEWTDEQFAEQEDELRAWGTREFALADIQERDPSMATDGRYLDWWHRYHLLSEAPGHSVAAARDYMTTDLGGSSRRSMFPCSCFVARAHGRRRSPGAPATSQSAFPERDSWTPGSRRLPLARRSVVASRHHRLFPRRCARRGGRVRTRPGHGSVHRHRGIHREGGPAR